MTKVMVLIGADNTVEFLSDQEDTEVVVVGFRKPRYRLALPFPVVVNPWNVAETGPEINYVRGVARSSLDPSLNSFWKDVTEPPGDTLPEQIGRFLGEQK